MIQAFSAVSRQQDPFNAGKEAAGQAVGQFSGSPGILWVFATISYDQQKLLDGIASVAGSIPVVGCTTDGEVSSAGLSTESVVVLALASDTITFHTTSVAALSQGSYQAGVKIGQAFVDKNCRYLQIFSDGLTGNAVKIIEGIKSVLGPNISIAGGAAGDGGRFSRTFQYHDGKATSDSIAAVAFDGDFSLGTGIGCGWFPVGTAKQVTKAEDNILYELDGRPALPVYEKFLGRYASQLPAVGVEYPLGLLVAKEDMEGEDYFLCRATMGVDYEKQFIRFAGDIPQGSLVKMTMGNENDLLEAAGKAAREALTDMRQQSPNIQPRVVFLYSCMARRIVLGSRTAEEINKIRKITGEDVPLIGFYTYGEYAPSGKRKLSSFHNETVTISIIGC
jgi:hypothetical protein